MTRAAASSGPGLLLLALTLLAAAVAARPGDADGCRAVAELARSPVGAFPEDWKPREDRGREIYKVLEEGGLRFIRATAEGTGIQIGKEFDWDLKASPVLAWKWRPRTFPRGADERESGKNDSALGVYAVFPNSPVSVKAVKYIWSASAPVGTTASASHGLTRMLVLRSGPRSGSAWVEESVDVARDYQRLFGEAPGKPRGVALLTDADDTKSAAAGDYADLRVCPASALGTPR
jgi:Protein of unknown function (DUF3047)